MSTDLEHLSNSKEIRCYFHCTLVDIGLIDPVSGKLTPDKFIDIWEHFSEEHQENFMRLGRVCLPRLKKIKDPIEAAYQIVHCAKENDMEVDIKKKNSL